MLFKKRKRIARLVFLHTSVFKSLVTAGGRNRRGTVGGRGRLLLFVGLLSGDLLHGLVRGDGQGRFRFSLLLGRCTAVFLLAIDDPLQACGGLAAENGQPDEELDADAVGGLVLQPAQILHVDALVGQAGGRLVAFRGAVSYRVDAGGGCRCALSLRLCKDPRVIRVDAGFRTGLASAGTGFPCGESARRMWSLSKRWMKCMGMVAPW